MKHFIKRSKKLFRWLSLRWDEYFVHNLVIGVSVIMIWAWVWGIVDLIVIDYGIWWRIGSIVLGILLLYLIDGSITQLWGRNKNGDKSD